MRIRHDADERIEIYDDDDYPTAKITKEDLIKIKIKAQEKFCKDLKTTFFAPYDGKCFNCNKQIFEYITLEKASTELITGCPICYRSFCD